MFNTKKTILIDLDGVLNEYTGDFQSDIVPEIKQGAKKFLQILSKKYKVVIFTTRDKNVVKNWILRHGLSEIISDITNAKRPCFLFIDDRCLQFKGDYELILKEIEQFTPWYYVKN